MLSQQTMSKNQCHKTLRILEPGRRDSTIVIALVLMALGPLTIPIVQPRVPHSLLMAFSLAARRLVGKAHFRRPPFL